MRYDDTTMIHAPETTPAIFVDIYQQGTGLLVGVGVLAPSQRYVSWLAAEEREFHTPVLSEDQWIEIENWIATTDQRLPAKPMPIPALVLSAFTAGNVPVSVIAERCASGPLDMRASAALSENVQRLLADMMRVRQHAV